MGTLFVPFGRSSQIIFPAPVTTISLSLQKTSIPSSSGLRFLLYKDPTVCHVRGSARLPRHLHPCAARRACATAAALTGLRYPVCFAGSGFCWRFNTLYWLRWHWPPHIPFFATAKYYLWASFSGMSVQLLSFSCRCRGVASLVVHIIYLGTLGLSRLTRSSQPNSQLLCSFLNFVSPCERNLHYLVGVAIGALLYVAPPPKAREELHQVHATHYP